MVSIFIGCYLSPIVEQRHKWHHHLQQFASSSYMKQLDSTSLCLLRKRCQMMSNCGHQWHLAAPRVPLFCSYHADFDGICERNHISNTNPYSFWPIPRVLVSQTERNRLRQNRSGVVKKRVRFGSSREKKKLITQHDPPLPRFFHSSVTLTQFNMALRFTTNWTPRTAYASSPTLTCFFYCTQFVPMKQFLSQAAAK